MSPEQITGAELDLRSDLFSMGILLYLMLTGQKPFAGDTVAVMFKIVHEDVVLPSQLNPQLTAGHDYIVLRSLAKDRAKRYSSAREFLDDLEDVRQGRPPRSQAKVPRGELQVGERTIAASKPLLSAVETRPAATPQRRRRGAALLGGAAALAIVAALGFWTLRRREAATPPPPRTVPATLPGSRPAEAPTNQEAVSGASRAANLPRETPQPAQQATAKASELLPSSPQSQPSSASTSRPAEPTGEPAKPAAVPRPSTSRAAAVAASPRVVYLIWEHDMKEAVLTVRSGGATIYQGNLKGKKKGGFLGIKGAYAASVKRPITVPAGSRELALHISSKEGGLELDGKITAVAPADPSAALRVEARGGRLTAGWQVTQGSKP
jgi:hypothetical protein